MSCCQQRPYLFNYPILTHSTVHILKKFQLIFLMSKESIAFFKLPLSLKVCSRTRQCMIFAESFNWGKMNLILIDLLISQTAVLYFLEISFLARCPHAGQTKLLKPRSLKVSLSRKQILNFSFEPKNEQKYFCISALASKMVESRRYKINI